MFKRIKFNLLFHRLLDKSRENITSSYILKLLDLIEPEYFNRYTPRIGLTYKIYTNNSNVLGLIRKLDSAVDTVIAKSYVNGTKKIDNLNHMTLDDFLTLDNGVPLTLQESIKIIKSKFFILISGMEGVEKMQQVYYERQFKHIFDDLYQFLLILDKVKEHKCIKMKKGIWQS